MKQKDKVAIVTGSSRGLGKAIAISLAREGASVVISARTEVEGKLPGTIYKTAKEIQALGGKALAVKCNVADEQSVNNMVQKALEHFGHIDILINNAGIAYPSPVLKMPVKRWELILGVNLTGTFLCTKAVLPKMVEQKQGSIVNISSMAATDVEQDGLLGLVYSVSKVGIERFTLGLAAEVGKYNIAVNAVKPKRAVDTEGLRANLPDATRSQWVGPDMMVKAIIFLAAQDSTGVTGTVAFDDEICVWHGLT